MKGLIITAVLALGALTAPTVASAGFMDELNAADQVNRVAGHRYHIDPIVTCRSIAKTQFTCKVTDYKGSCLYTGRANVRKVNRYTFRVTTMHVSKECI
jgi:hypothetical protein